MIYLIYKDGEILVETDDIEYVRTYMSKNQECSVRDARTGKKIPAGIGVSVTSSRTSIVPSAAPQPVAVSFS